MYCSVIGKECIEKECKQYRDFNAEPCRLSSIIGHFLYRPITGMSLSALLKYLDEIRPEPFKGDKNE